MTDPSAPEPRPGLIVATVWLVAVITAGLFSARTRIGPTLVTLSENRGVHLGDVVACGLGAGLALLATVVVLREARRAQPDDPQGAPPPVRGERER